MGTDGQAGQVAAASVIIPTIGRTGQLETTLDALAACRPRADEILVVDQSDRDEVAGLVERFENAGARRIKSSGRGVALAANEGLRVARHETILFTDDDCTVEASWVGMGHDLLARHPDSVFTGRVLPLGDADAVPTTAVDPVARDCTGELYCSVLVRSNMVAPRSAILALGAFDERFLTSAEDDDLCYRWLKAGGSLRYEPDLAVWHRDWRGAREVEERHVRYGREQAWFYVKHVRAGDMRVLRFLARDLGHGLRALVGGLIRRDHRRHDPRRSVARGVLRGLASGWRMARAAAVSDSYPMGSRLEDAVYAESRKASPTRPPRKPQG